MKVHISLNVKDVEESVNFYRKMLGTEPAKHYGAKGSETEDQAGYAKFDVADPPLNLALNEAPVRTGGSLSHLGLQVQTSEDVAKFRSRWEREGLGTFDEENVACCYARQDKTWVTDPDGNEWEAFVVLSDIEFAGEKGGCDCSADVTGYIDEKQQAACGTTTASSEKSEAVSCC